MSLHSDISHEDPKNIQNIQHLKYRTHGPVQKQLQVTA